MNLGHTLHLSNEKNAASTTSAQRGGGGPMPQVTMFIDLIFGPLYPSLALLLPAAARQADN